MTTQRRTQAQRRAETSRIVLENAIRLFGERGYGATALEDIAHACDMTTRPIFHYFGNKKALFAAVNDAMEQRILASLEVGLNLDAFLGLCEEPGFRRIVLVDAPNILDVRKASEYNSEHVIGAVNTPLDYWWDQFDKLQDRETQYVLCRTGYRSMVFASIMKAKGHANLINVAGGMKAIKDSHKFQLSDYICPTTML